MLSVAAHADEPEAAAIAFAALSAVTPLDDDRGVVYPDFILALLPLAARAALEKLMLSSRYEFKSDLMRSSWLAGIAEGKAEGRAAAKAEIVLKLLRLKGLSPSEAQQQRVLACADEATLDLWTERVLTATRLDDVFAG